MTDILTLDLANAIINGALAEARAQKLKPLTVAVLDAGGHLVALQRQDGTSNLRPQIAMGKANGSLQLGVNSRKIGTMAAERPHFVGALASLSGSIIPVAGGVLFHSTSGRLLGAVGLTGDTSDNDEAACIAGITGAGLVAAS